MRNGPRTGLHARIPARWKGARMPARTRAPIQTCAIAWIGLLNNWTLFIDYFRSFQWCLLVPVGLDELSRPWRLDGQKDGIGFVAGQGQVAW